MLLLPGALNGDVPKTEEEVSVFDGPKASKAGEETVRFIPCASGREGAKASLSARRPKGEPEAKGEPEVKDEVLGGVPIGNGL